MFLKVFLLSLSLTFASSAFAATPNDCEGPLTHSLRPRLIATIPVDGVKELKWSELDRRAVLEFIGSVERPTRLPLDAHLPFLAIETPEPISAEDLHTEHLITQWERLGRIKEPRHVWDLQFFHQSAPDGKTVVALRRSIDGRRAGSKTEILSAKNEIVQHEGEFHGESVDALIRQNGRLALAVSAGQEIFYLEREPSGEYTSLHLSLPPDAAADPSLSLHETRNGEILLAVGGSARAYVLNPHQSAAPLRSYPAEKSAVTWLERDKGRSVLLVLPEKGRAFAAEPTLSERTESFGEKSSGEGPSRAETIVLKNGRALMAYTVFTHERPLGMKILVYEFYGEKTP
jgi:hypothetical protein